MWVLVSTAFITAAVIFLAYGAAAGVEKRKSGDVRRTRIIRFSIAAVTGAIGFYIMLFVQ